MTGDMSGDRTRKLLFVCRPTVNSIRNISLKRRDISFVVQEGIYFKEFIFFEHLAVRRFLAFLEMLILVIIQQL
jgi:hypothetical protein